MKEYHKLIRDKIPEIMEKSGKAFKVRRLNDEEVILFAEKKLSEELGEYLADRNPEELADLLEVMEALVRARGFDWDTLLKLKDDKKAARGGFEKRILLLDIQTGQH